MIDRATLEAAFPPGVLVTLPEAATAEVEHRPTREFLRDVGIPDHYWLQVTDGFRNGVLETDRDALNAYLPELGPLFENWVRIGTVSTDRIYLDTRTGAVHSIPDGGVPVRLNSGIQAFVHFLYLLQLERPDYDLGSLPADSAYESGAEDRLRERMRAVDPVAFQPPEEDFGYEPGEPTWEMVLRFVADKLQ